MPIKPENRHRYPANWTTIRAAILDRANHHCEQCGVPNHTWINRYGHENSTVYGFIAYHGDHAESASIIEAGHHSDYWGRVYVVLTIAHLDHTPEHNDPANLRALCNRCHLRYDAAHHTQTAYRTRRAGKAAGDLFDVALES